MAEPLRSNVTSRLQRVEGGVRVHLTERLDLTPAQLAHLEGALRRWEEREGRSIEARCTLVRSSLDPLGYRPRAVDDRPRPCCVQVRSHLSVPEREEEVATVVRELLEVSDLVEGARAAPG